MCCCQLLLIYLITRIERDRLFECFQWERIISGERLEFEEAAVCGFIVEEIPLRSPLKERLLCTGRNGKYCQLKKINLGCVNQKHRKTK